MPTILRDIGRAMNTLRNTSQRIKDEIIHDADYYQKPIEKEVEDMVSDMRKVSRKAVDSIDQADIEITKKDKAGKNNPTEIGASNPDQSKM